jgi:hypothetical protein
MVTGAVSAESAMDQSVRMEGLRPAPICPRVSDAQEIPSGGVTCSSLPKNHFSLPTRGTRPTQTPIFPKDRDCAAGAARKAFQQLQGIPTLYAIPATPSRQRPGSRPDEAVLSRPSIGAGRHPADRLNLSSLSGQSTGSVRAAAVRRFRPLARRGLASASRVNLPPERLGSAAGLTVSAQNPVSG